jgi:catechol 2,3-dioxygenase-like lactoylglutathione lyase family enzyme
MPSRQPFNRIESIVLRVHDRHAAVAWYRAALGLQVLLDDPAEGMAVLNVGHGYSVTLWELREDEVGAFDEHSCTFPIFEADDAARQRRELQARGVVTSELREIPGLRCFSFWDLDGNRLDACEVLAPVPG